MSSKETRRKGAPATRPKASGQNKRSGTAVPPRVLNSNRAVAAILGAGPKARRTKRRSYEILNKRVSIREGGKTRKATVFTRC